MANNFTEDLENLEDQQTSLLSTVQQMQEDHDLTFSDGFKSGLKEKISQLLEYVNSETASDNPSNISGGNYKEFGGSSTSSLNVRDLESDFEIVSASDVMSSGGEDASIKSSNGSLEVILEAAKVPDSKVVKSNEQNSQQESAMDSSADEVPLVKEPISFRDDRPHLSSKIPHCVLNLASDPDQPKCHLFNLIKMSSENSMEMVPEHLKYLNGVFVTKNEFKDYFTNVVVQFQGMLEKDLKTMVVDLVNTKVKEALLADQKVQNSNTLKESILRKSILSPKKNLLLLSPKSPKTDSTVPSKEKIKSPVPSKEKIKSPVPSKEKTKSPVPSKEKTKSPVPSKEKTKSPVPSKEKTKSPVPSKETKSPVPSKETKSPVPSQEKDESPVPSKEKDKSPVPSKEKDESPVPSKEKDESPVPSKEKDESPVPSKEKDESPVPSKEKDESPVPSKEKAESPVPSIEKDESPVPSIEKDESPVPSIEKDESPVPSIEKDESPVPSIEKDESPMPSIEKDESPVPSIEKDESPVPSIEKDESPVPSIEKDESPVPSIEKDESPVPSIEKDESPVPSIEKDESPVPSIEKDESPVPSIEKDESPVPSIEKDESPVPSIEKDESPVPAKEKDESPEPAKEKANKKFDVPNENVKPKFSLLVEGDIEISEDFFNANKKGLGTNITENLLDKPEIRKKLDEKQLIESSKLASVEDSNNMPSKNTATPALELSVQEQMPADVPVFKDSEKGIKRKHSPEDRIPNKTTSEEKESANTQLDSFKCVESKIKSSKVVLKKIPDLACSDIQTKKIEPKKTPHWSAKEKRQIDSKKTLQDSEVNSNKSKKDITTAGKPLPKKGSAVVASTEKILKEIEIVVESEPLKETKDVPTIVKESPKRQGKDVSKIAKESPKRQGKEKENFEPSSK